MKLENYLLILLILGSGSFLITFSAYADNLTISEGVILHYKYFRINSAEGKQISGDALFQIVTFDSSSLKVQISSKNAELRKMKFYIKFESGIPVYADRLEALIFLPSQCIAQSLEGNLDWITSIKTGTLANVTGKMCKTLNFTTEAGTYKCLNITLNLVGWEYGTLTLIYDINSGILVYEKWTPTYGDIIVQRLTAITSPRQMKQPLYNLILSIATITLPAAVLGHFR